MSLEEFCNLYFEEFESACKAWQDMNHAQEREAWERTRILAAICIQPHIKKKITPKQLLPLPWDRESIHKKSTTPELSAEEQRKRFEEIAQRLGGV